MRVLQFPLQGAPDQTHLTRIFKGAYDVLYTYMIGNSRKNALYFAKYIDFFQTQITVKVVSTRPYQSAKLWSDRLCRPIHVPAYLYSAFS